MSVTRVQGRELVVPTDHDVSLAAEACLTLAACAWTGGCELTMTVGETGESLRLPASAVRLLLAVLSKLGSGNSVTLDTVPPDLATHRAADLLRTRPADHVSDGRSSHRLPSNAAHPSQ